MEKERNRYVYIFCDPRHSEGYKYKFGEKILKIKNKPFYIGAAHKYNYKRHLSGNGHSKSVQRRIEKIREENLEPIVKIVKKYFSKKMAFKLEEKLIISVGRQDLKTGPLLNKSDGRGCKNASINYRNRISKKSKEMWKNPEFKEEMIRKRKAPENIKRFKDQSEKKWKDPEFRKKMVKMAQNQWRNIEYREKMTKQASGLLRKRNLKNWKNSEYREKMIKAIIESNIRRGKCVKRSS